MNYTEKLKDPRWQKKRLKKLEEQDFTCEGCDSKRDMLHVHHLEYVGGRAPWEYANDELAVLCDKCHTFVHKFDLKLYHLRVIARLRPSINMNAISEVLDTLLTIEYSVLIKCKTDEEPDNKYMARVLEDMEAMKR